MPANTLRRSTGSSVPFDSSVNLAGHSPRISSNTTHAAGDAQRLRQRAGFQDPARVLPNARHTGIRNKF